jgi:uncharacterized membrane protein YkvA (DUF1232 family)
MGFSGHWRRLVTGNLALIWGVATDRRLPWRARAPAMLALAYVASPIDLVPDFLPGIGWLDDVLVIALALAATLRLVPHELVAEHTARAAASGPRIDLDSEALGAETAMLSWLLILVGAVMTLAALIAAGLDLPLLGPGIYSR